MGRGSYVDGQGQLGAGWGCDVDWQEQQCSETTFSVDFASSQILRYSRPSFQLTQPLIESLSQRLRIIRNLATSVYLEF